MESRRADKRKYKIKEQYFSEDLDEELKKEQDLGVADDEITPYNNKVKIQLKHATRVVVSEDKTKSGKRYVWERAGAIVEVDEEDAPELLQKRIGQKPCCSGSSDNMLLFVRVE